MFVNVTIENVIKNVTIENVLVIELKTGCNLCEKETRYELSSRRELIS